MAGLTATKPALAYGLSPLAAITGPVDDSERDLAVRGRVRRVRRRAPIPPAEPWHSARPGVERAYRVDPSGTAGPTKGQTDGRYWRTVAPGWFRPVEPPTSVEQRIVEASYRMPAFGGVTGWAALRWLGGRWFEGIGPDGSLLDVPVCNPQSNRNHWPGVHLTKERLRPDELSTHEGLRITSATRSVLFEMRHAASTRAAVRALDMACFNDLVSLEEVRLLVEGSAAWEGIQQARDALGLGDENAWSPAEVDLRLTWTVAAGLGPVRCNAPIFDLQGRHLVTPDLVDPVHGVVGEYQGGHHFERSQRRRDVQRETLLRDHGLEYVECFAGEHTDRLVARLRSAYARAARLPESQRRWTLTPPRDWISTVTVAQRRGLGPRERTQLLAHRTLRPVA